MAEERREGDFSRSIARLNFNSRQKEEHPPYPNRMVIVPVNEHQHKAEGGASRFVPPNPCLA